MSSQDTRHILNSFEDALQGLRSNVLMMATLTERGLEQARKALFERDTSAASAAIADDEEIDQLEVQIDHDGMQLITRFRPLASDFRAVISSMKMSVNIERIADQVTGIARRSRKLNKYPELPEVPLLQPMFDFTLEMFRDATRAFAEGDLKIAHAMKDRDRVLDDMNREIAKKFTQAMPSNVEAIKGYLNLIFIARFLERIGDHSTNICEDAVFVYSAEDIRHGGSN
ncbi:MAG: phosphate signaling complex protein PhoU [Chthoniobacterales bacterium]